MQLNSIQLQLQLASSPAPGLLMQALVGARVTRGDQAPSTFELTFHSERLKGDNDFSLVNESLLAPFTRTTLVITVGSESKVLIDGFITEHKLVPSGDADGTRLTVIGEDVSLHMGQLEVSFSYPRSVDDATVAEVLLRYAVLKIVPKIIPTPGALAPQDFDPMENGTDRDFLLQLAGKHGYRFFIEPGEPELGWNTAYWGPPPLHKAPQKSLVANPGPSSNVQSIEFHNNALAPSITYGAVSQDILPSPVPQTVPVVIAGSTRDALSAEPGLGSYEDLAHELIFDPLGVLSKLAELKVRGTLMQPQNDGNLQGQEPLPLEALAIAQADTNTSTDKVTTASGKLETWRYGQILEAPGVVPVRGAGYSFDGLYYVDQVVHTMDMTTGGWAYSQEFSLSRGGLGSTIQEVAS